MIALLLFGSTLPAWAQEKAACPVSGKDVNPAIKAVYQGKEYSFCCKSCLAKFEKNPEKYIAKIKTGEAAGKEHAGHEHGGKEHAGN